MYDNIHAAYSSGVRLHLFLDIYRYASQIYLHIGCFYSHDGKHTGAKGRCNQISRRKSFSLTVVVGRSIRFYYRLTLQVGGCCAQLSLIYNL